MRKWKGDGERQEGRGRKDGTGRWMWRDRKKGRKGKEGWIAEGGRELEMDGLSEWKREGEWEEGSGGGSGQF